MQSGVLLEESEETGGEVHRGHLAERNPARIRSIITSLEARAVPGRSPQVDDRVVVIDPALTGTHDPFDDPCDPLDLDPYACLLEDLAACGVPECLTEVHLAARQGPGALGRLSVSPNQQEGARVADDGADGEDRMGRHEDREYQR